MQSSAGATRTGSTVPILQVRFGSADATVHEVSLRCGYALPAGGPRPNPPGLGYGPNYWPARQERFCIRRSCLRAAVGAQTLVATGVPLEMPEQQHLK